MLTAVQAGSAFVSAPVPYIADHNTSPPLNQVVKTDPSSLLLTSLQSRKSKEDARKVKARKAAADKAKRPAEEAADGDKSGKKRAASSGGAGPSNAAAAAAATTTTAVEATTGGGSGSGAIETDAAGPSVLPPTQSEHTKLRLSTKTVKDLQIILKAWGLPVSGKKEDLVTRIIEKQEAAQGQR